MIIFIAGETGSGKTDTGWALIRSLGAVFLDSDWFASRSSFSWDRASDVESVYRALSSQIAFHLDEGRTNFVVTLTPEMAVIFQSHRSGFEKFGLPIHAFRLAAEPHVIRQRILERDRDHKGAELANAARHRALLDAKFADNSIFVTIDNTDVDEQKTASAIVAKSERSN